MSRTECFNSVSHLVGAILALPAGTWLVIKALQQHNLWKISSFSIYTLTLFLLFLFSTLYHSFQGRTKQVFRKLDHISIYLLIAGSYTPFMLVSLRSDLGWWIFSIIWLLGICGIILEFRPLFKGRLLPVLLYLGMGWLIVVPLRPLLEVFPAEGFHWLLAGGLFYTIGALFYVFSRRFPWIHGVWHVMVLGGAASHYLTIYRFVL